MVACANHGSISSITYSPLNTAKHSPKQTKVVNPFPFFPMSKPKVRLLRSSFVFRGSNMMMGEHWKFYFYD